MSENVVYQAIFENEKYRVTIEYKPLPEGLIEIVDIHIQQKDVTQWQEREQTRKGDI